MSDANSIHNLTQRNVETISQIEKAVESRSSRGERASAAVFGVFGSWTFITFQCAFVTLWVVLNSLSWIKQWDPFPFALLGLLLAIQVAFASPIIVMSQNRQAKLSDARNHLNLQISLLSEQENTQMLRLLRLLCDKAGIEWNGSDRTHQTLEQAVEPQDVFQQITASEDAK